jgi:hypothetical protein
LHTILSSIKGFQITENFLQCNKKAKVYDVKSKLNLSNQLIAIKRDEYLVINSPDGKKEVVYSNEGDLFETYCNKINAIDVITKPEKCHRDLKIQYVLNDQNNFGFLSKSGIIRNNSLQEKCLDNYETFIKIKNFFIIKFKDKIIIKDENDILKFEVYNKNFFFDYFEQLIKVINQQHNSIFIVIIIVILILGIFFSKNIKKYILELRKNFVQKSKHALDDSVIIIESDHNLQNREIIKKGRSKDKCVRYVDYDIDEVKITKNSRSNKKSTKKNLNN